MFSTVDDRQIWEHSPLCPLLQALCYCGGKGTNQLSRLNVFTHGFEISRPKVQNGKRKKILAFIDAVN